ncbi:MAG TPA: VCBS repeat-containing protein, partial [Pirellulaceae bacterium]|nr:VCBS repeat-containing protein [Pirellulaceae bacterium]
NAIEAENCTAKVTAGSVRSQNMAGFKADKWSGGEQLFWSGGRPGDKLDLQLSAKSGEMDIDVVLSCARDYAIVQLQLDGEPLGKPVDLFEETVLTTGVLTFPKVKLKDQPHTMTIQILGANEQAASSHMVGIDFIRFRAPASK